MPNYIFVGNLKNSVTQEPLASYQVELWDREPDIDLYLGIDDTDATGTFEIEVTGATYDKIISSFSPYFKIFSGGVLVENTKDSSTQIPGANINVTPVSFDPIDPVDPPLTDYTVSGAIVEVDGSPATGNLEVRAYDRSLGQEKLLGQVTPAVDGSYTIEYTINDLSDPTKDAPDLLINVVDLDATDPTEPLAESPVISNALNEESINLVVGEGEYKGPSEYQSLDNTLATQTASLDLANIPEKEVTLMAGKNDITVEWVDFYLKARYFSSLTSIDAEVFYGLMRREQPDNLQGLLSQERETLRVELEAAAEDNVINANSINGIEILLDELEAQVVEQALNETQLPAGEGSLAKVANAAGLNATVTRAFLDAAAANSNLPSSEFWQHVRDNALLAETDIEKIQLNLKLSAVSLNNMALTSALQSRPDVNDAGDLAELSDSDWDDLTTNNQTEIPESIAGDTPEERRFNYATLVKRVVENAFPTRVLARKIRVGTDINDTDTDTFFTNNPEFEFRKNTVTDFLKKKPTALDGITEPVAFRKKLEGYQRTFRISPPTARYDSFKTLYNNNVRSAWDVKRLGKNRFIKQFSGPLGGEDVAKQTYRRAAGVSSKSIVLYSRFASRFNRLPTAVFNADITSETGSENDELLQIPNLTTLFDSQDFCACKHCRSVLSPAAFLVDLFQYLKEGDHTDGSTALDKLKIRRPDLTGILLGCENTNTELPYIDLVNELLEELVSPTGVARQTTWDTSTLRAQPEHLNVAAYDATANVVFPISLPFNLWNAEGATYLKHLSVERFLLTEVFTPLQTANRARDIALVHLGMSGLDFQVFETPAANAFQLYGLSVVGDLPQLQSVENLLDKLQITYPELVEWMKTRLVNPDQKTISFSGDNCALQEATLTLDNDEYGALNRYERVARKSGWSSAELDMAVALFGEQDRADLLIHLSGLIRLQKAFKLKAAELLVWHGTIDTYRYGDKDSFYATLFLNPALHNGDVDTLEAFALNPTGTEVQGTTRSFFEESIAAVTSAATSLKSDELTVLVNQVLPNNQLSLAHLSYLYRIARFCRANRLTVQDYLVVTAVLGETGLAVPGSDSTPALILSFINQVQALRDAKLSWGEQAYLHLHQNQANIAGTSETAIAETLHTLQNELRKYSLPADTNGSDVLLQLRIGITKLYDEATGLEAQAIVEGASGLSEVDQQAFIDTYFADFADTTSVKGQLVGTGALTDQDQRARLVTAPLLAYLSRTTLYQRLTNVLDISEAMVISLLENYTTDPLDSSRKAVAVFLDDAFVLGAGETSIVTQAAAFKTYERLIKAGFIVKRLRLGEDEAAYLLANSGTAGWTDFANLSVETAQKLTPVQAQAWLSLLEVVRLQRTVIKPGFQLTDLLAFAQKTGTTLPELAREVSKATEWEVEDVTFLLDSGGYGYNLPSDFANTVWMAQLEKAFALLRKTGASAAQAWGLTGIDLAQGQANVIRNLAKARYDTNERWLQVAPGVRDPLRIQQRDALRDYILAADDRFKDTNDLFAYYLMDTEMAPCMITSRVKLAISSVQLWVQRIQMNLEPGLSYDAETSRQWKWRKNYRVWEANRKVFLFPENWIEPELRDDKSVFFTELENFLQQSEVTSELIEGAYLEYLDKLHEVAHLEVVSTFQDEENQEFHVMARTYAVPHVYYYRKQIQAGEWTAWERVGLEIESDHFVLVRHNRRLYFFWATMDLSAEEPDSADLKVTTSTDQKTSRNPDFRYNIRLGWSEQRNGQWLSPQSTKESMESAYPDIEKHFLMSDNSGGTLRVDVVYARQVNSRNTFSTRYGTGSSVNSRSSANSSIDFYDLQGWVLNDSTNSLEYDGVRSPQRIGLELPIPRNGEIAFTKFREAGNTDRLELPRSGNSSNLEKYAQTILRKTPGTFQVTLSHQYDSRLVESPFFYSDGSRTFFVNPTEDTEDFVSEPQPSITKIEYVPVPKIKLVPIYKYRPTPQIIQPRRSYIPPSPIRPRGINNFYQGRNGSSTIRRLNFQLAQPSNELFASNAAAGLISSTAALTSFSSRSLRVLPNYDDFLFDDVRRINPPRTRYVDRYIQEKIWRRERRTVTIKVPPKRITLKGQKFRFYSFYHPYTLSFLKQVNKFGAAGLLDPVPDGDAADLRVQQRQKNDFSSTYLPDRKVVDSNYPKENIDFAYDGPYGLYNWELFFHAPLMLATELSKNQQFEEAQTWFHYIFDPTQTEGPAPQRYWRVKPFHEFAGAKQSAELLKLLNEGDILLEKQVEQWEKFPFKPHLIARMRVVAYMKTTVMKYLDNLIAWGDNLFRRDTIESINEASQVYLLAAQILGRRPVEVEKGDATIRSYDELENNLDDFSNGLVDLESELRLEDEGNENEEDEQVNVLNSMLFFCVPNNDKMLHYWDTVGDRLFKIRNCQNIEGVTRQLSLFAPPIDPALLVRAAAAGVDLGTALQDLNAPLPLYRFDYMLQRAYDFCNEVKSLGTSLLSSLEKKDAEELSLLRAGHQVQLLKAIRNVREKAIDEAKESLDSLKKAKELAQIREAYYAGREYMNNKEQQQLKKMEAAVVLQTIGSGIEALAGGLALIPDAEVGVAGAFGSPFITAKFGGEKASTAVGFAARVLHALSAIESFGASKAGILGGYDRRRDDWELQTDLAETEIEQIDKQILAAEIRLAMAERELENHELQTRQAQEEADFMEDKYTNWQLYSWMVTQLGSVYFQTFQMAYDMAKKAERNLQFELAVENTNYIRFGYWDSLKKGLLAGEQLQKDLRRLEMAYLEQNRREYELTKHVAISMVNAQALANLRETGTCEVMLPEVLFDMDYPGQYMRRLKGVSISIPCVTAPYTNVSCQLTLLSSRVRKSQQTSEGYAYTGVEDDRFIHYLSSTQGIATSSAQRDSGLFEFNFRDERYLPFERMGAVSRWRITLPDDYRQFDYDTISDVILHLNYTARDGGEPLKTAASQNLQQGLNLILDELSNTDTGLQRLFSFEREFPNQLHGLLTGDTYATNFEIMDRHLPRYLYQKALMANEAVVMLRLKAAYQDQDVSSLQARLYREGDTAVAYTPLLTTGNEDYGKLPYATFSLNGVPQGKWIIELDPTSVASLPEALRKKDVEGVATNALDPDVVDDWYVLLGFTLV
ncbi:hypothetical protein FNH22_09070 [Fulvivirga sp. M361]|uniref:Tc toxin subunit A-related protein n=1 Tax=Fulvivirga sp. M361 TaxID=2594266 RepID=UPI001179D914|nr:neuraminidase-like domain-containing protein [Fulvivirga sp. M361]TRX60188.1 hypothetical protein FNH22_09070 [Fulvivirga sp. M361]